MTSPVNVVFDIGNVLLRWNPAALLNGLGFSATEQPHALANIVHTPEWLALDRGDIDLDEAVIQSAQRAGYAPGRVREVYLGVGPSLQPMEPLVTLATTLAAAGHPLYVLSNMPEQTWRHIQEAHKFFNVFNGLLLSFEENLIKPEAGIYQRLLTRFELEASRTLFIDDHLPNVLAAQEQGLGAVHLADPDNPSSYRDELLAQIHTLAQPSA